MYDTEVGDGGSTQHKTADDGTNNVQFCDRCVVCTATDYIK